MQAMQDAVQDHTGKRLKKFGALELGERNERKGKKTEGTGETVVANEKKTHSKEEQASKSQWLYVGVILVLAFAMSFLYVKFLQPKAFDVNGLKVISARPPGEELPALLAENPLILREELFPGNNSQNAVVGVVGAEMASVFGENQRTLGVYGHVAGAPAGQEFVNCVQETRNCSGERIVVKLDPCNCLKVEGGKLYVLYTEEEAKKTETRLKLRGLLNAVLAKKQ